MAAGHAELTGEMAALEKLSMPDRLKHAKKRRSQQLKAYTQYEKQLNKETAKKSKKGNGGGGGGSAPSANSRSAARRLQFDPSILLLEATMRNDVEEVNNLLNAGVDPNVSNEDGLRALHQCSIDNLGEVMKLLIQSDANVNVCDTELWTPLHAAATCGHMTACQFLVEHGAELLAVNSDGNMPYDLCEDPDTLDYIESEMAKRGITQEMIDDIRLSAENKMLADMKKLFESGDSLEFTGSNGETPLHIAACCGYVYVAEFLLAHSVAVNVADDDGWMPLHCAACWGQLQLVELLLLHGADFEARTKSGETSLDLCEDIEMKQRVLEIIEEVENNQPSKSRDNSINRRNSAARKGSTATAHALRRTAPHDKSSIALIEAQEEAARLREPVKNSLEDDDDDDEDENSVGPNSAPIPTDADQIDLCFEEESPANEVLGSTKPNDQKPIKSIIAKSSQYQNSPNKASSSVPAADDIWMTPTSPDNPLEKSSGKDAVDKENKKWNKKDANAADKSAKGKGIAKTPPGDASGTDRTSASPSNQKTTKDVNHKADSNAVEKGKKSHQTDVPSSANTPAPSSGEGRIKTNDRTSLGNGKNSNVQNSVASNGVSSAASRSSKVAFDSVDSSSSSKNNSAAEGFVGNSLTGTLADLKKQRAKRLQDALKENGKSNVSSEPTSANGDVPGDRVSQTAQTPLGNDRLQSRYDNSRVAATGNDDGDRGCCVIL